MIIFNNDTAAFRSINYYSKKTRAYLVASFFILTAVFLVAGIAALLFGLIELKLLKLKLPSYGGIAPQMSMEER